MFRFAIKTLSITTLCVFALAAQTSVNFSLCATTEDSHFDLSLRNINAEAEHSLPSYYTSMRVNFGTPSSVLDHLLYHEKLSPADAFMAVRLSILIGKPVDEVVTVYRHDKKKGWGAIAKSMGIKPGSKEFHELKNGGTVVLERTRHERSLVEVEVRDDDDGGDDHGNGHGKGHGNGKHHDKGKGK